MKNIINQFKGIVIKVGSKAITTDRSINSKVIDRIAKTTQSLREQGKEVSIVTSGAIAAGRRCLGSWEKDSGMPDKQTYAAVGQPLLMQEYISAFSNYGLNVAQFLVSREDFKSKKLLNLRNSYSNTLARGIIPIFNENDTVATDEISFSDNDELQLLISEKLGPNELLINLTLYDGLIRNGRVVKYPKSYISSDYDILESKRNEGRGGLQGKLDRIQEANQQGMIVIVGNINGDILGMINGRYVHSRFLPLYKGQNGL
jgi:glutamate 5-kinase